jgi:type II secretory pathway pseudopilin PulG
MNNFSKITRKSAGGFTLIEVIVYLALFAIMFGGAMTVAYNVIESSGRNQTRALLQEEGDFLIAKINWTLSGAQTVVLPNPGSPSSVLTVNKFDGTSVTVNLNGQTVQLVNSIDTYQLNNSSALVQVVPSPSLVFTHTSSSGDGVNPEKVDAKFTLTANTPTGAVMTQDFFTTVYLRK